MDPTYKQLSERSIAIQQELFRAHKDRNLQKYNELTREFHDVCVQLNAYFEQLEKQSRG